MRPFSHWVVQSLTSMSFGSVTSWNNTEDVADRMINAIAAMTKRFTH